MKRLSLHLKILFEPDVSIDTMLTHARKVFDPIEVDVAVASRADLDAPLLRVLKVKNSCDGRAVSAEQRELFGHRDGVGAEEIVIYFVRETDPPLNGCAQHPDGQPGTVVSSQGLRWTLAHELGHVLGLKHVNDPSRIMHGDTSQIAHNPPGFEPDQLEQLDESPLLKQVAKR
jgi:hypothetical protein